jgi:hypothetical protein
MISSKSAEGAKRRASQWLVRRRHFFQRDIRKSSLIAARHDPRLRDRDAGAPPWSRHPAWRANPHSFTDAREGNALFTMNAPFTMRASPGRVSANSFKPQVPLYLC